MGATANIPDRPVLLFLAKHQGEWASWFGAGVMPSVRDGMPVGTIDKLVLSKMRSLVKRGLVNGCVCGCRGDFEITDAGLEVVGERRFASMICPTTEAEKKRFVEDFERRHA